MCLGFRFCSVVLSVIWLDKKEIQLSQSNLFILLYYEDVCVLVGCNWRRQTRCLFCKIIEQGFTGAARWLLLPSPSWLGALLVLVCTQQPPLSCRGEGDGGGCGHGGLVPQPEATLCGAGWGSGSAGRRDCPCLFVSEVLGCCWCFREVIVDVD